MREFAAQIRKRLLGNLRTRLTVTYVAFFALLLGALGVFFQQTLRSFYDDQLHTILNEEWGAVLSYLRIEKPKRRGFPPQPTWYYDRSDPEEALAADRLQQNYLLTTADGKTLYIAPRYKAILTETAEAIRSVIRSREAHWQVRRDPQGNRYLVRSGVLMGEDKQPYYFSMAHSYAESERVIGDFMWSYAWMLPLMILSGAIIGWWMAGRALRPVNDVANTAQRITSSNLAVQIPVRGSGDELDQLIEAFNRMTERLDQSFQQTRQFSTDVSHELRTPLTAIRGQLEVALMAATTPEQYQEAIATALEDVERLSQTIRALLLLSHAESGQLALHKQIVNLSEVAEDIVDQFGIPAESVNVRLRCDVPAGIRAEVDRIQIERLISNLVSNAVKYTRAGGEVKVQLQNSQYQVHLLVADTGVGIPREHLPYIFDRFYRVPEADRPPGSSPAERGLGLGLSFVAWIVRAHNGMIDVESEPGVGTNFTVCLPKGRAAGASVVDQPGTRNDSMVQQSSAVR